MQPIEVTLHVDPYSGERTTTVTAFPSETAIDFYLLGQADRDGSGSITVEDPTIILRFSNGQATYRLALSETDGVSSSIPMYLVSSRLSS